MKDLLYDEDINLDVEKDTEEDPDKEDETEQIDSSVKDKKSSSDFTRNDSGNITRNNDNSGNNMSSVSIQSIVRSEVQKQMKNSPESQGRPQHQSPTPQHHTPVPSHSSSGHTKKTHRTRGKKRGITSPHKRKVLPRPSYNVYNVVYEELERVNIVPTNRGKLIEFKHTFNGDHILFSPVSGTDTPDNNMKRVHRFMTTLFNFKLRFVPVYTDDVIGNLTDIIFVVFPRGEEKKDYDNLKEVIKGFIKRFGPFSYVECVNGFHTLITEEKTVHYTYGNMDTILENYTRDRGIKPFGQSFHFLNPTPQSKEEFFFRRRTGEICV